MCFQKETFTWNLDLIFKATGKDFFFVQFRTIDVGTDGRDGRCGVGIIHFSPTNCKENALKPFVLCIVVVGISRRFEQPIRVENPA